MMSPSGIAAPDVCDGTSAVGESRHRIPRRIIRQPTCLGRPYWWSAGGRLTACPTHWPAVEALAAALVEEECIEGARIERIIAA
jgi:hypothetical protein